MAKQIVLNYEGKEYTLAFNRKTVERMERNGFVPDTDKPYNLVTNLFVGAFGMYHKNMDREKIMKIWDAQNHKEDLLTALVQMYNEPLEALMEDAPDQDPTWKVV